MSLLNSTWEASIDGIKFLLNNDVTQGGRRKTYYEYISTNRRQAQDLGKSLRKFNINGIIEYDPTQDGDYLTKRNQLIEVLESNKTHILIHPFYGTINVSTGIYSLKQSFAKLGIANFSFEAIEVSNAINNSLPIAGDEITQQTINDIAADCINDINDNGNNINIFKKFKDAYESAKDIGINTLKNIQKVLSPLADEINDAANFIKEIENDIDNITALINNPTALIIRITDLISGIDNLSSDIIQVLAGLKRFNEFGNSINSFTSLTNQSDQKSFAIDSLSPNIKVQSNPITEEEKQITSNANIIIDSVKQSSLVTQYRISSQIIYNTTDEINNNNNSLENQNSSIKQSFSHNLINDIAQLRSVYSDLSDKKILNTSNKILTNLFTYTPLSVLSYNLYGDSNEADTLKNLNTLNDSIAVKGKIKVLTNARN